MEDTGGRSVYSRRNVYRSIENGIRVGAGSRHGVKRYLRVIWKQSNLPFVTWNGRFDIIRYSLATNLSGI
jgi:hypothetical protein